MKMEQSVPKRRYTKFRRRGITQKKAYNNKFTTQFHSVFQMEECERHMTFGTRSEHGLGTACPRSYMCELAFTVTSASNSLKPLYIVIICQYIVITNTGLFISPSGISELDCASTKTDTAERSITIGRESLQVFFVLGALAYFQVPPLGGSRDEKWRSQ